MSAKLNLNLFPELVKSIVPVAPVKLKFAILVSVPPREIVSSPKVIDEFARFAFVIPALPYNIAFVIPDIVLSPATIVLFVNV